MLTALKNILTKFPGHIGEITLLYRTDQDFRTICEEYLVSIKMLKSFQQELTKMSGFELEYLQLYLELKTEIEVLLKRNQIESQTTVTTSIKYAMLDHHSLQIGQF